MEFIKNNNYINLEEQESSIFSDMNNNPALKNTLNYHIEGINEARNLILSYLHKPIRVIADYDTDGIMSGKGLSLGFSMIGAKNVEVLIPEREDGYGGKPEYIDNFKLNEDALIIFVDNGIVAFDAIDRAKELGYKVIVIDHHDGDINQCKADVVIDGHAGTKSDFIDYCSAGQVFKLWQSFSEIGFITSTQLNILSTYAAIGTIGDVVNLIEKQDNQDFPAKTRYDNWNIVKNGLKIINDRKFMREHNELKNLRILLKNVFPDYDNDTVQLSYENISWTLVPTINAAGRIKSPKIAYEQLTTKDNYMMQSLAKDLIAYNDTRKALTTEQVNIALSSVNLEKQAVVYVTDKMLSGLAGLVAAALCGASKVPTFVGINSNGLVKGSARCPEQYNLLTILDNIQWLDKKKVDELNTQYRLNKIDKDTYDEEIEKLKAPTYLNTLNYGGHQGAAGFSVSEDELEVFTSLVNHFAGERKVSINVLNYDFTIKEADIEDNLKILDENAPYGPGHPVPVMKVHNYDAILLKTTPKSLKLTGRTTEAIHFKGDMSLTPTKIGKYNIYGTLGRNTWEGVTKTQIKMIDIEQSDDFER
jgi:single-stranded-DNA-specific exonuclease